MRKLTTQDFISHSRSVHSDKYDYSLVQYYGKDYPVKIICPIHGVFEQSPHNHKKGAGCKQCGVILCSESRRLDTECFIKRAQEIHSDRYNYSRLEYKDNKTNVEIICSEHGRFLQSPSSHLSGKGCPSCGNKIISKKLIHCLEQFINKAKSVHGNKYRYEFVNYKGSHQKVLLFCREHGLFEQNPTDHLSGKGCPGCANYGFDRTRKAFLYVLRSECGRYMKIGITNKPDQRHAQLSRATPFPFERIELIEGQGDHIADLEKELLAEYLPAGFTETFDGYSEWRLWDDSIRHKLHSSKLQG